VSDELRALILGLIEGLTEFLPISSTGHMILARPWLGIAATDPRWDALLWVSQFAAILAVVFYFGRDLLRRIVRPVRSWREHFLTKLAAAMVPTVVIAVLLKKTAERYLENPPSVGLALIVGAIAMAWIDRRFRRDEAMDLGDITLKQAFWIGVIQCLSLWSGISRSGATIMGGMALGLTPRVATEFSFYLAIPTMLAAAVKKLGEHRQHLTPADGTLLAIGCAAAFVTSLAVAAFLIRYVRTRLFTPFVVYRIVLGTIVLVLFAAGWMPG
jgi:undecaprenyl-diphosphatase